MHVALLTDSERLRHESALLERVAAGLLDDGVRVTRIAPPEDTTLQAADAGDDNVPWHAVAFAGPTWMQTIRARRLLEQFGKAPPDVIYAVGGGTWPLALRLGRLLDTAVVIDVWSVEMGRRVPRGRAAGPIAAYVAPTEPLAAQLRERVAPELVALVRPGVPAAPPRPASLPDAARSIAIIGRGRDGASYAAMLAGLSRVIGEIGSVQAVIELRGTRSHGIWREARRLDLLPVLSAITDAAPLRELVTGCETLVMPERFGEVRSLTLEAMAAGMTIVSAVDPVLDMIRPDDTAAGVDPADDPEAWARQLRRVLRDEEYAAGLSRRARACIEAGHRAEDHVEALRDLFERVVSGGAFRFAAATAH